MLAQVFKSSAIGRQFVIFENDDKKYPDCVLLHPVSGIYLVYFLPGIITSDNIHDKLKNIAEKHQNLDAALALPIILTDIIIIETAHNIDALKQKAQNTTICARNAVGHLIEQLANKVTNISLTGSGWSWEAKQTLNKIFPPPAAGGVTRVTDDLSPATLIADVHAGEIIEEKMSEAREQQTSVAGDTSEADAGYASRATGYQFIGEVPDSVAIDLGAFGKAVSKTVPDRSQKIMTTRQINNDPDVIAARKRFEVVLTATYSDPRAARKLIEKRLENLSATDIENTILFSRSKFGKPREYGKMPKSTDLLAALDQLHKTLTNARRNAKIKPL